MTLRAYVFAAFALSSWACGSTGSSSSEPRTPGAAGATTAVAGSAASAGGEGAQAGEGESAAGRDGVAAMGGAGLAGAPESAAAGGGDDGSLETCPALPSCDAALPELGEAREWRHWRSSIGGAQHRGRDLLLTEDEPQWIIANFRYGLTAAESALDDEEIDVYLLRDCGSTWEKLGTALTSADSSQREIEGVGEVAGRFFFEIPKAKQLGLGRHRLRLVVAGDLSGADVFIEVVRSTAQIVVSDVDGTLTTSENAEFSALLAGSTPEANPAAAAVLNQLALKGYRPLYLTARPEWLVQRSREFLAERGFPAGILHSTLTATGATNEAAATFKSAELERLRDKGFTPVFAFGNTDSDAQAYDNAEIEPLERRIFFKYTDEKFGGRRIENYGSLLVEMSELGLVCAP